MEIKNRVDSKINSGLLDTVRGTKNPYKDQQVSNNNAQGSQGGLDTVTVSSQSKTLMQASKILDQDAIARREKIESIKARVQNGSYSVDSKEVASSIISYFNDDLKVANS